MKIVHSSLCIQIATRKTYGDALVKLGKSFERIVALDGDTKNSTFSLTYKNAFPNRYIECFIAEQNLCGVGIGLGCRDRNVVFCSTFAAFFTRAFDQIRMGAISQTQVNFVGSHAGCSIGECCSQRTQSLPSTRLPPLKKTLYPVNFK